MIDVRRSRVVPVSSDAVWAVLADFASISAWAPNVSHSSLTTTGTVGPGTTRRVQAGRTTLLETIAVWEPGHTLAYDIAGLPKVIRSVRNRWDLVSRGDTTEVTLTSTIDAGPRPPQKLIAKVAGKRLAKESESMLGGIAAHITGERA
jgi:hypothetical protein